MTDGNGRFSLEKAPPGIWTVMAKQASPEAIAFMKVSIPEGGSADAGDIELGELQLGLLRGRVLRIPQNEGVEGLDIMMRRASGEKSNTTTGHDGQFEFPAIKPGQLGIYVPEYHLYTWQGFVEGEHPKEIVLYVGSGRLEGKVTRGEEPVAASIKLVQASQMIDQTKTTAADGSFLFAGLVPGTWTAKVTPKQFPHLARDFEVEIAPVDPTRKSFTLPSGTVQGVVLDREGKPVPNAIASISILPKGQAARKLTARTDAEGNFAIPSLDAGSYTVVASHPVLGVGTTPGVQVSMEGETPPVKVRLTSQGGTLKSVALKLETGQPVPEAWCQFFPVDGTHWKHEFKRGRDGVVTVTQIPPGKYRINVSYFGLSISEREVEIKEGETVEIEDVLYEAGALNFTLHDAEGKPIPDARLRIQPDENRSVEKVRELQTDAAGAITVRGLMPGRYTITAEASGGRKAEASFGIQKSNVTTLHLTAK